MHLELVELLRCPVPHAASVLVASADRISNRYVTEGLLGCPECYAEYAIRHGVTHFAMSQSQAGISDPRSDARHDEESSDISDRAMRLAAQLGLNPGRTVFALVGYDIATMFALREIVPARMLLLSRMLIPNESHSHADDFSVERLQSAALVAPFGVADFRDILPLVPAKFDGIAIHASYASPHLLEQSAAALRHGGRMIADVRSELPAGMRELVRDDRVWVAERESVASVPVGITRR